MYTLFTLKKIYFSETRVKWVIQPEKTLKSRWKRPDFTMPDQKKAQILRQIKSIWPTDRRIFGYTRIIEFSKKKQLSTHPNPSQKGFYEAGDKFHDAITHF
jgi:hypothetical protein